tara:strand:- start:1087 stop:1473 length:387 start_codon:yes stop_codon:yes gene_type:complete
VYSLIGSQSIKKLGLVEGLTEMGWWPFRKRREPADNDPHMKGARAWIQDLREICERNYENPTTGQSRVREMQVEWSDSHAKGEIDDALLQGLDRRAFRLLRADDKEWIMWLDDEDFWEPGWKGGFDTE